MVEIPQDMIGLEAANAELDRLEAADAAATNSPAKDTSTDQSANKAADRAAQPEATTAEPDSISTDTPATPDTAKTQQTPPKADQTKTEPSRYEKDRQRRDTSWKALNEEKTAVKSERERLERERQEFQEQRKQTEAQYSPEQYDQAAKNFEAQGKFDLADLAKTRAEELRKNPPPTPQQQDVMRRQQADHDKAMKEWWGKAAVDYPNVAKDGSPENAALKTFIQTEPDAVKSPKGMYYAARLVQAETAAARVPDMDKELGALRAKVKELETLTAPGGPSIPGRAGQQGKEVQSDAEQFAELERMAQDMGTLR